jgi:transcriptional regulator with XRE-family HTH domain
MEEAPRRVRGEHAPGVETRRPSRRERAREIARLREREGLSFAQIAERLGLAPSTVRDYHRDPDAERNRRNRERYRGTCELCGRPTTGGHGYDAPRQCARCARARSRVWSRDRIVAAIRNWRDLTGEAPTVLDWSPAHADDEHPGAARFLAEPGRWPSVAAAQAHFGSFSAAIEAAGVEPAPRGARTRWTPDRIVEAIRAWQHAHGAPPTHLDWQSSGDGHPARSTVYRVMGSWEAALEAASR